MKYEELIKALRHCTVDEGGFTDCRGCPEEGHSFDCETKMHMDAADAIKELNKNWKYCSDMLNLALKVSGLSMTALVKLYETEAQE